MKKLIFFTLLFIALPSLAQVEIGIIAQAECNTKTGTGIAEIQTLQGNTLVSNWVKINSTTLCTNTQIHDMTLFGKTTVMDARESDNLLRNEKIYDKLVYNKQGYLIEITKNNTVPISVFSAITEHIHIDRAQVHQWYFQPFTQITL
jgi:hypothetical protein